MEFVAADAQQQAIVAFCTASKAIQDATTANKEPRRKLRGRQAELREQLLPRLRRAGPNACVEVTTAEGPAFARIVTKRGGTKQVTPSVVVEGLRALTADDLHAHATTTEIVRTALDRTRGEAKDDVAITRTLPPLATVARLPDVTTAAGAYEACRREMRQLTAVQREVCAPHKQSIAATTARVAEHLQRHNPQGLRQEVRLSHGGREAPFVLRATKKPGRFGRAALVREAEAALAEAMAAVGKNVPTRSAHELLAMLHDPRTLASVEARLRERIAALKTSVEHEREMQITFAPARGGRG